MRRALPLLILLLVPAPAGAASRLRGTLPSGHRHAVVSLRDPAGRWVRFRVHRRDVMAPGRARRASRFRGYAGESVDGTASSVRIDRSVLGLHASVRGPDGSWYLGGPAGTRTVHSEGRIRRYAGAVHRHPRVLPVPGASVVHRTYRLALASDAAYAQGRPEAQITAAKETLVARVSQVYEDELGVTLKLIANPLNSTPVTGGCDDNALDDNQAAIDSAVGSANYDIGHVVLGGGAGGIAELGVVGHAGHKAMGCTGLSSPIGDTFAIDYVAHEMGHQFDAEHTFNGGAGNCAGGTRNGGTAVEPGSGSSIMAYAGICGADNLQAHTDPYFSQRSIQEIQGYITSGSGQGGNTTSTGPDRSPVVTPPAAATIPIRTPFTLSGSATDEDGDPLVYTWEQNDTGSLTSLQTNTKPSGALFRMFSFRSTEVDTDAYPEPGENVATAADASRTFPDAAQVAAGATNALTGTCTSGSIDCFSEFLPTSARTLHFRLTARDLAGGVSNADTTVAVAGTQPFAVTSQAAATSVAGGATLDLTWDPAGTATTPFNVAAVRIALSVDGGLTFPFTALASTPNDGAETITVPNAPTTVGRLRVAAIGSPFFSMNRANLEVTTGAGPTATPDPVVVPTPTSAYYDIPATPVPSVTATVTATTTATPGAKTAGLRPVLTATRRRLRVSRHHRVRVRIACIAVGDGTRPGRCRGTLRLLGRRTAFSFPATKTVTRRLRVSRRTYRRLRHHRVKATVRASVGVQTASRRVILRR